MCYACKPTLTALNMPNVSARGEPTGPQYFTFDLLPESEKSPAQKNLSKTNRLRKRSRKVLYPPVVKRYYPTEEPSYAKRLLFILLTIVFFQVYQAEEHLAEATFNSEENISSCSLEGEGSQVKPVLMEQPVVSTPSLEMVEVANGTGWHWEEDRTSESAVDITYFLQQNPAAF